MTARWLCALRFRALAPSRSALAAGRRRRRVSVLALQPCPTPATHPPPPPPPASFFPLAPSHFLHSSAVVNRSFPSSPHASSPSSRLSRLPACLSPSLPACFDTRTHTKLLIHIPPAPVGVFDWTMTFTWAGAGHNDPSQPIISPTMAGGLFAIERNFFFEVGTYDEGMMVWGAENLEMSFRCVMTTMLSMAVVVVVDEVVAVVVVVVVVVMAMVGGVCVCVCPMITIGFASRDVTAARDHPLALAFSCISVAPVSTAAAATAAVLVHLSLSLSLPSLLLLLLLVLLLLLRAGCGPAAAASRSSHARWWPTSTAQSLVPWCVRGNGDCIPTLWWPPVRKSPNCRCTSARQVNPAPSCEHTSLRRALPSRAHRQSGPATTSASTRAASWTCGWTSTRTYTMLATPTYVGAPVPALCEWVAAATHARTMGHVWGRARVRTDFGAAFPFPRPGGAVASSGRHTVGVVLACFVASVAIVIIFFLFVFVIVIVVVVAALRRRRRRWVARRRRRNLSASIWRTACRCGAR